MSGFDVEGDMTLAEDESDWTFVSGAIAIAQEIKVGAQIMKGSWYFDRNVGIDYLENIFVKSPDLRLVRLEFWNFLASVDGVMNVKAVDLRVDTASRTLFVTFEVETDFGTISDGFEFDFGLGLS